MASDPRPMEAPRSSARRAVECEPGIRIGHRGGHRAGSLPERRPTAKLVRVGHEAGPHDIIAGEVQAYIGNDFVTQDRPDEFTLSVALSPIRNGIGHRVDTPDLDRATRAALASMIADGSYLAILDRYGMVHVAIRERP